MIQLLGLLLIAILSMTTDTAAASSSDDHCFDALGCEWCIISDDCDAWICPFGDERGVGVLCYEE